MRSLYESILDQDSDVINSVNKEAMCITCITELIKFLDIKVNLKHYDPRTANHGSNLYITLGIAKEESRDDRSGTVCYNVNLTLINLKYYLRKLKTELKKKGIDLHIKLLKYKEDDAYDIKFYNLKTKEYITNLYLELSKDHFDNSIYIFTGIFAKKDVYNLLIKYAPVVDK